MMDLRTIIIASTIGFACELLWTLLGIIIVVKFRKRMNHVALTCLSIGLVMRFIAAALGVTGIRGDPDVGGFLSVVFDASFIIPVAAAMFLLLGSMAVIYQVIVKQSRMV